MITAAARIFFRRRLSTDCCRSSPERGGGPPKVVGGHGRSRVTHKGQETPRVPLHHASHGPPPPKGEDRQLPTPKTAPRRPQPPSLQPSAATSRWRSATSASTGMPLARAGAPASRSEEHTSELQSLMRISYAVFCLKKKKPTTNE